MTFRPWIAMPLACLLASLAVPSLLPLRAQEAPEVVLSDAPAFCQHLQRTLAELANQRGTPLPDDVERLSNEGTRLCEEGSTRAGILRLRQAMVMMSRAENRPEITIQEMPAAK